MLPATLSTSLNTIAATRWAVSKGQSKSGARFAARADAPRTSGQDGDALKRQAEHKPARRYTGQPESSGIPIPHPTRRGEEVEGDPGDEWLRENVFATQDD